MGLGGHASSQKYREHLTIVQTGPLYKKIATNQSPGPSGTKPLSNTLYNQRAHADTARVWQQMHGCIRTHTYIPQHTYMHILPTPNQHGCDTVHSITRSRANTQNETHLYANHMLWCPLPKIMFGHHRSCSWNYVHLLGDSSIS